MCAHDNIGNMSWYFEAIEAILTIWRYIQPRPRGNM